MGNFLGYYGIFGEDKSKDVKILVDIDSNIKTLDLLKIITDRGSWVLKPWCYEGTIDGTYIAYKRRVVDANPTNPNLTLINKDDIE